MAKDTFRVVTRGTDGTLHIRDYNKPEALQKMHTQIGIDDCSTDLGLRGQPVFRGLIGPMPEGKNVIRYESPEVFETLTKEWSTAKTTRAKGRAPARDGRAGRVLTHPLIVHQSVDVNVPRPTRKPRGSWFFCCTAGGGLSPEV